MPSTLPRYDWIYSCRGEGVVISHDFCPPGGGPSDKRQSEWLLSKWKASCEPQTRNEQLLADLVALFDGGHPALSLLPAEVEKMFRQMDACVRAPYIPFGKGAKPATTTKLAKGSKAATPQPFQDDIQEAIASALTKYDSADSFFARGAVDELKALLLAEVVNDVPEAAQKNVVILIAKHIGQAFKKWRGK